jgi:phage protein U
MMLGNFQFSLKTLSVNSLSRSTEFNWVGIDRAGDLPYVQNLGITKDDIEIGGIFYPKLIANNSNYRTVADIRNSNLCKTANNLITDFGEILGKFVIVSITENQSYFDKNGVAQKVEFKLMLKRTPGAKDAFVGIGGANSLVDTDTNLARGYLKW